MKKGFTLIELLVVIAIISILATLGVASYSGAQTRARDARRKSDLDAIKKALEIMKSDSQSGAYYPVCNGGSLACGIKTNSTTPNITSDYIKTIPTDPVGGGNDGIYYWYATRDSSGGNCTSSCTGYALSACLENKNDTQKDSINTCPDITTRVSYTISNP